MTPPAFDPARYPRTYTASARWRATWLLLGGGMAAWGLAMVVDELLLDPHAHAHQVLVHAIAWLAMALVGLFALASVMRARIVIGPDFIQARSIGTWRLRRSDIVDYRVHVNNGTREFRLRSRVRRRPFTFTQVFKADEAFTAWFADLVDTDRRAHEAVLDDIAGDDRLGATSALRLDRMARVRRVAPWLLLACNLVALWTMVRFEPGMPAIALTAIQPVVALFLAWRFGGLFTLATRRPRARVDLNALLLMPGLALGMRALLIEPLASPWGPLGPALAVGGLLVALALAIDDGLRSAPFQAAGIALVLVLYAGGMLEFADMHLDRATPRRTNAVTITASRHTHGKGASALLTLVGAPGHAAPTEFRVGEALWRRSAVGDRVCFVEHPGAFGWKWTEIEAATACPAH